MATLSNIKGKYVVQVKYAGKRRSIYLGRVSQRQALSFKTHVEQIVNALDFKMAVPNDTAKWLWDISAKLHGKLAAAELVAPRDAAGLSIRDYFDAYIAKRTDLKPRTIANLKQVRNFAVNHFGATRWIDAIERGEVKDWHRALLAKYAQPTVAMHVKKMRQLFADAVDRKRIASNPFTAVKAGSMANAERMEYVPVDAIAKVIAACPDHEWRLLFALARYAGLRVPSETRDLKWSDINFETGRFIVTSTKTERYAGKAQRAVPIFHDLLPYLLETRVLAIEETGHVFRRLRGENLATTAQKIITRAGLVPWGKTFQNLRSSCETDLATRFGIHVACAWIGNSTGIAMKHYLQVHDAFFDAAAKSAAKSTADNAGQDQTQPALAGEKHRKTPANGETRYPQGGSPAPAITAENIAAFGKALQKARHATDCYARHTARLSVAATGKGAK